MEVSEQLDLCPVGEAAPAESAGELPAVDAAQPLADAAAAADCCPAAAAISAAEVAAAPSASPDPSSPAQDLASPEAAANSISDLLAPAGNGASERSLAVSESTGAGLSALSAASGHLTAAGEDVGLSSSMPQSGYSCSLSAARSGLQGSPSRCLSMQPPPAQVSAADAAAAVDAALPTGDALLGSPGSAAPPEPAMSEEARAEDEAMPVAAPAPKEGTAAEQGAPCQDSSALPKEPAQSDNSPVHSESSGTSQPSSDEAAGQGDSSSLASSPSRLSVWQLMQARERERAASPRSDAGTTRSAPTAARGAHTPGRSLPPAGSRSQSRLASCYSSPALSTRQRRPATSAGPAARGRRPDSGASAGSGISSGASLLSPSHSTSSLLRPTASYVAAVEETRSRKQLRQQDSMPSSFKPKPTEFKPFKISTAIRAQDDYMRVNQFVQLTTEERAVVEAEHQRKQLAQRLKGARQRCNRSLSAQPPARTPTRTASPPEFKEFKLRSVERHEAYAQAFAMKLEAARQAEAAELAAASPRGSRPSSRIGALHSPGSPRSGPPLLQTEQRAVVYQGRNTERQQQEEEAAATREAERQAQLSPEQREAEEAARERRFRARPMPDFAALPVFSPDKRKAQPPTVPCEFKFRTGERSGQQTPQAGSRSASRLRNEASNVSQ